MTRVIFGAGMVGAMWRYYATRAGLRVLSVERDQPAAGSSGHARALCSGKEMDREFEMTRPDMRQWHEWRRRSPTTSSTTTARRDHGDRAPESMARAAELAKDLGGHRDRRSKSWTRRPAPERAVARDDLAGGFFYPATARWSPRRAVVAVLRAAVDGGAELRVHEEVLDLLAGPDGVVTGLRTRGARCGSPRSVIAGGFVERRLGERNGLTLPIPTKGTCWCSNGRVFPITTR